MGLTRRDFLLKTGQAGGFGAACIAMQGLGLMEAHASEPPTDRANGGRPAVMRQHCKSASGRAHSSDGYLCQIRKEISRPKSGAGLEQDYLAKMSEIGRTHVSQLENGRREVREAGRLLPCDEGGRSTVCRDYKWTTAPHSGSYFIPTQREGFVHNCTD